MNKHYPESVIKKILDITLENQHFFFVALTREIDLIDIGGKQLPAAFQTLVSGQRYPRLFPFVTDFMAGHEDQDCIPTLDIGENIIVDVHLFRDNTLCWAIFRDKSKEILWQQQARQKQNELALLESKFEQLKQQKRGELDVCTALNILALKREEDNSFRPFGNIPYTFEEICPKLCESLNAVQQQQNYHFLDNFLIDANSFWDKQAQHSEISSGPWIEKDRQGNQIALEAIAVSLDKQALLFIKKLDHDYQFNHNILQIGREGALIKNRLEELVHERTSMIRAREEEIALRLVCAADKRDDGETGSHIRRLGLYSELIASHLGWPKDKVDEIRIAAPMHDIGKIGIPDSILRKPERLTKEEYEIMKRHPVIGGQILSNSKSPLVNMAKEICLGHHEKWDGSGYPYGLAGKHIPTSARIVAIVDVFDALIHKRVYKEKMSVDKAIDIMKEGRGSHFDPDIFDLFLKLSDELTQISEEYCDPHL